MVDESANSRAAAATTLFLWRIKAFFGRNLVQYYLSRIRRYAKWALVIFLLWRFVPILYESAVFPFDLDLFALQAATARASDDHIRRAVVLEAQDRGLRVEPEEVRVQIDPERRVVTLDVTYRAPIDLLVKEFNLDFHSHSSRSALLGGQEGK